MIPTLQVRSYRGSYLVGYIMWGVVAIRAILHFQGQPHQTAVILIVAAYGLLYSLEPRLWAHFRWLGWLYFPLQTALILTLAALPPFLDITNILFIPLGLQALYAFSRRVAIAWMLFFIALLNLILVGGKGWAEGLALGLMILAAGAFMVSYDLLYARTQRDQEQSQVLLADLQVAHRKLQEYAAQAEELAKARERNRLARELHDSVSQVMFSVALTAKSARILLARDPAQVPEQLDRLQEMTGSALSQLRSLIAQLRSTQNP